MVFAINKNLLALSLITGSMVALTVVSQSNHQEITSINSQTNISQLSTPEISALAQQITVQVSVGTEHSSGILIAKDHNTYTVITNARAIDRGATYTIQTADGIKHEATIVTQDGTDTGNDLATLAFDSSNKYPVGKLGNSDSITPGETAIAAGFPQNKTELLITEGKIALISEKPLKKGYAIAFTNKTVQGMSGGVLLNAMGEVIGVLGKGKDAILNTAYNYIDGSQPTSEEIATYREMSFSIPIANIQDLSPQLASLLPDRSNPAFPPQPETVAQIPTSKYTGIVAKVDNIAQQITVRIATPNISAYGSGAIIARQGNTYYVATAKHVVRDRKQYQIVTPDGATYPLDNATIKQSEAYDFAIFSFSSAKDYTVATLGNYLVGATEEQVVFVAGFPKNKSNQRLITGGKATEREQTNFRTKDANSFRSITPDRPGLLYTNLSYKGMSGGAVLDSEGRLIGINTAAENEIYFEGNNQEFSLGYSLGVPIQDIFGFLSQKTKLKTEWLQTTNNPAAKVADNDWEDVKTQLLNVEKPKDDRDLIAWMNFGNQLWRYEQYKDAVDAFERVVAIEPNFHKAYYAMGLAYQDNKQYSQTVTALTKATQIDSNPYYYWRYLGFVYRELKQYDRAISAYQKAIAKSPQDFVLYVEQGDVLQEAQRDSEAIASYNEAVKINPEHPWIYNNRGLTFFNLKEYEQAIADYNRAISINPESANTYNNRGNTYSDLKEYERAIADYNKAIVINPNSSFPYNNRGIIYSDLKEYERAIADYDKAISLDSQDSFPYNNRGTIYSKLKKYERAIADYDKALAINPNYAEAYSNRGSTYRNLKQYYKALSDLEKAISLDPKLPSAYNHRGNTYRNLKEYDRAMADFNQAIALDPQSVEAYNNRGVTYDDLKEYDRAMADFNQAISLDSRSVAAYNNRGNIYVILQKHNKAIADFNRAIALDSQSAEAYNNRGNIYYGLQQYERAIDDFNHAIAINYKYANAYYNRGNAYSDLTQYDKAIADYDSAISINPQSADAYYNRGIVYDDYLKKYDRAIADYKSAIAINPQSADAYTRLGIIYYQLQDIPQTRKYLGQAANLFKQQGYIEGYQAVQNILQKL